MAGSAELVLDGLIMEKKENARIADVRIAASYNWLDTYTPTILVPGIPPIYSAPHLPPRLSPDAGTQYIDQNGDRNPGSPLESLVNAVHATDERFDFRSIDIITDRRPIRKLFGFVNGDHGEPHFGPSPSFKFSVEMIGGSALFTRIEDKTREELSSKPGHDGKMRSFYRQSFESSYTKIEPCGAGSTSHHQILQYRLGDLKCLVRNAVDAYLPDEARNVTDPQGDKTNAEEELVAYMKATSLDRGAPTTNNAFNKRVTVKRGGRDIPREAMLELVTRKQTSPFEIQERMPDLWISQTVNFLVCRYRTRWSKMQPTQPCFAIFDNIIHLKLAEKIHEWETNHLETLQKLAAVLKRIIKAAKCFKNACIVSFSGEKGAPLTIEEVTDDEPRRVPSLSLKARAMLETAKTAETATDPAAEKSQE